MSKYRVKDGIRVVLDGQAYSNGQTFTAEPGDVRAMLEAGWVTEVDGKAIHGEQVEDKAVTPRKRAPRQRS